jgi:hypothetical protein
MTTKVPFNRRLTRYLAIAALVLGLAIGSAAVANAVWDIGGFDQCMSHQPDKGREESVEWERLCCVNSGGVWKSDKGGCFAPGVDSQGNRLPNGAPTHVIEPLPLPGQGGPVINPAPGGVA